LGLVFEKADLQLGDDGMYQPHKGWL